jgi:hypothetical protein
MVGFYHIMILFTTSKMKEPKRGYWPSLNVKKSGDRIFNEVTPPSSARDLAEDF